MLGAGQTGARASVPWPRVGPGWVLAEYSASTAPGITPRRNGATTLYLIDPAGGRYRLYRWPAGRIAPGLVDWSGDKARALLTLYPGNGLRERVEQLTLATGTVTSFLLPFNVTLQGYTNPNGLNILAWAGSATPVRVARYDLRGRLQAVLARARTTFGVYAKQSPDGTVLAVNDGQGLKLVSNASGHLIRRLGVPGRGAQCYPERWWSARTILAGCFRNGVSQLWLVASSGGTARAITPGHANHADPYGVYDAWRLRSGLYLQAVGACSAVYIVKQLPGGGARQVNIPGTVGNNNRVLTSSASRLLVQAETGCPGSDSLLWFNPATRAVQTLLRPPVNVTGVVNAVPYGRLR
jgi:TolB protein